MAVRGRPPGAARRTGRSGPGVWRAPARSLVAGVLDRAPGGLWGLVGRCAPLPGLRGRLRGGPWVAAVSRVDPSPRGVAAPARAGLGSWLRVAGPGLHADRWAGARDLFVAYPLVVGIPAALADPAPGDGHPTPGQPFPSMLRWLIAAVCVLATAYIAVAYFPANPAPRQPGRPVPPGLSVGHLARRRRQAPLADRGPERGRAVDAVPLLRARAPGLGQPGHGPGPARDLLAPLQPAPCRADHPAARRSRSAASPAAPTPASIAACLVLLVGQLNLNHETTFAAIAFLGVFFTYLYSSPSVLFGMILLVPLLHPDRRGDLIAREHATRVGDWVLIGLFMVGASDAKVVILPMIIVEPGALRRRHRLLRRRLPLAVPIAGGLATDRVLWPSTCSSTGATPAAWSSTSPSGVRALQREDGGGVAGPSRSSRPTGRRFPGQAPRLQSEASCSGRSACSQLS